MSVNIYIKSISIAKNLLICLAVLFNLSGCEIAERTEDPVFRSTPITGSSEVALNSNPASIESNDSIVLSSTSTSSNTNTNTSGTTSVSVSTTVNAPPAPTVNISASPSSLPYDGSTTLNWSSDNTSDCTASGDWSGSKVVSGSQTISALTTNSSFSLFCSGPGGSVSDSVSITVAAPPVPTPTLSFSTNLVTVSQNGSTTLSWNTTDVTSCTATGDWSGSKSASGSETINSITTNSQFTLTCSGMGGTVNDTIDVAVVQSNNGTALLSWTPPTENTDNSALTDLAGYKIYYGTSSGSYDDTITISNPGLTSYLVENLASSDWYFVMTSVNSSGIESSYSIEVTKTIN
jgi:hypothetical protein